VSAMLVRRKAVGSVLVGKEPLISIGDSDLELVNKTFAYLKLAFFCPYN